MGSWLCSNILKWSGASGKNGRRSLRPNHALRGSRNLDLQVTAQHIVPWASDKLKAKLYANSSEVGPWLEYLPFPVSDQILMKAARDPASATWGIS
ncbi:Monooxygenase FAD-binding [Penicillium argentinense]|uniref:Monooxygenase FAD-binding n=1 Tax=Penicillium argentinense TaxID=1131581 RepID=A0A9W9KE18_9EURO|nr:Monooxygenase FAD-binding [Penicillium argentinense]KAJ5103080.1 Monooxygenase FAD-binding [Penicillium argentinense]